MRNPGYASRIQYGTGRTYARRILGKHDRASKAFRHLDRTVGWCIWSVCVDVRLRESVLLDRQDGVIDVSHKKEGEGRVRYERACERY